MLMKQPDDPGLSPAENALREMARLAVLYQLIALFCGLISISLAGALAWAIANRTQCLLSAVVCYSLGFFAAFQIGG
jgi:hypothetical protein